MNTRFLILSFVIATVFTISISETIQTSEGLSMGAERPRYEIIPGETLTDTWTLINEEDTDIVVKFYVEGEGSEFLTFEEFVVMMVNDSQDIEISATIPEDHPGGTSFTPMLYAEKVPDEGGSFGRFMIQPNIIIGENPNPIPKDPETISGSVIISPSVQITLVSNVHEGTNFDETCADNLFDSARAGLSLYKPGNFWKDDRCNVIFLTFPTDEIPTGSQIIGASMEYDIRSQKYDNSFGAMEYAKCDWKYLDSTITDDNDRWLAISQDIGNVVDILQSSPTCANPLGTNYVDVFNTGDFELLFEVANNNSSDINLGLYYTNNFTEWANHNMGIVRDDIKLTIDYELILPYQPQIDDLTLRIIALENTTNQNTSDIIDLRNFIDTLLQSLKSLFNTY